MKLTVTSAFAGLALLVSCATPGITYVTEPPGKVAISEENQPLRLLVKDVRTDESAPSENETENEVRAELKKNLDIQILKVISDHFTAQGIRLDQTSSKVITVEVVEFSVQESSVKWIARVKLNILTPQKNRTVQTQVERPNVLGKSDAYKTLSAALSQAIDGLDWDSFVHTSP